MTDINDIDSVADVLLSGHLEGDAWATLDSDGIITVHDCDGLSDEEHVFINLTPREAGVLAGFLLKEAYRAGWRP